MSEGIEWPVDVLEILLPPARKYVIEHLDHDFATLQTIFPENLNFVKNIRDASTINYEISYGSKDVDDSDVVYEHDIIRPFFTGWRLRYTDFEEIDVTIMEGIHTMCNAKPGRDFMKVNGIDYTGYLDYVKYPFNPQSPNDYRIKSDGTAADPDDYTGDNPPRGYAYKTEKDVAQIINDLFAVCWAVDNRLPITCALDDFGYETKFQVALGETTTLLSMLKSLSDIDPGFDFIVNNDREFHAWTPFRYGTSDSPDIAYNFDKDTPGVEQETTEFTVTGPKYTHVLGLATAPKSRLGRSLGATLAEEAYWRLDGDEDFGEVVDQDQLNEKTKFALKYWNNPVHEIPFRVYVEDLQDVLDPDIFWEVFRAGFAIFIDWDLVYHRIDSAQRIISMDCKISNNGNGTVDFGLNQIYDLTGIGGDEEG